MQGAEKRARFSLDHLVKGEIKSSRLTMRPVCPRDDECQRDGMLIQMTHCCGINLLGFRGVVVGGGGHHEIIFWCPRVPNPNLTNPEMVRRLINRCF